MNLHILGICGTLMGSIALLARDLGHLVTGTDVNVYPPMSTQLETAGIALSSPYTADCIPNDTELVIVGNAGLPRGNPALEALLNKGTPYTSGAEWLSRYLLHDRWVIAVAGTHGKTTTASMIAWILDNAGLDPGFLIGGVPNNFPVSSRLGGTPFFVIEADEYDTSYFDRRSKFLHYRPRTLVLNNLEFDHADIFEDLGAIKNQFHLLLRSIPGDGLVIHPDDDQNLEEVLQSGCWTSTLKIGTKEFGSSNVAEDGSSFTVRIANKDVGRVSWQLTGMHNVANGLAAIAAARHVGVSPSVACEALCLFAGVKRRMEILYSNDKVTLYDDFAHHPTAIATTLEGLRNKVGDEIIMAIIEPASHTMRKGTHAQTLALSTEAADSTLWYKSDSLTWDIDKLSSDRAMVVASADDIVVRVLQFISDQVKPIHLVVMSNGSFAGVHQQLIDKLKRRERN